MKRIIKCGIYNIVNQKNNRIYIGGSFDIERRFKKHLSMLRTNKHCNKSIQSDFNNQKEEDFKLEIIELCDKDIIRDKEMYYLKSCDWHNAYNQIKYPSAGGYKEVSHEVLLLNLKGEIVKEFDSGNELCLYLGGSILVYNNINTKSISRKKYRIVTTEFYKNNLDIIKLWRHYSNEYEHKKLINSRPKYKISRGNETHYCFNLNEVGEIVGLCGERIRQVILDGCVHKNTGYRIMNLRKKI